MLPGTFWLKVAWSPPGWRRPKTLVEAASEADLSQRLPVKREPTKVPRERHGRNPGHSWPGGCQLARRVTTDFRSGSSARASRHPPAPTGPRPAYGRQSDQKMKTKILLLRRLPRDRP